MIEIKLDAADFQKKVAQYATSVLKVSKKTLNDIGYEVLRLGENEVPHDLGPLQTSSTVEEERDDVIVGYNKEYAARLHEHPEYNFQKGRKAKYLEDPIANNLDIFLDIMGDALNSV